MNKLGFYIERSTVEFMRDALRAVKPPVILFHAGDRGLLQEIRRDLSPDSFIIGRMFVESVQQDAWLDDPDPGGCGRAFADQIIDYDFGYATERGANGRLLVDAWMSLNEPLRGPASFPNYEVDAVFRRRAGALDRFQEAFRERLQTKGLEAVAFNFGAGNYTRPEHYRDWFPRTLASYRYLGFHEYGWPSLKPGPGTSTAALYYRSCMEDIRRRFGSNRQAIVTEAGLARLYCHPDDPAGDVGWLYPEDPVSEDHYWDALQWYNDELLGDDYVLGACLFQVGHGGRWETFRHLGVDGDQKPIQIIARLGQTLTNDVPEPSEPETGGGSSDPGQAEPGDGSPGTAGTLPDDVDVEALCGRLVQARTAVETSLAASANLADALSALRAAGDHLAASVASARDLPGQIQALGERLSAAARHLSDLEAGPAAPSGHPDLAALSGRIVTLQPQMAALQSATHQIDALSSGADEVEKSLASLAPAIAGAAPLRAQAVQIVDHMATLARRLESPSRHVVPQPAMRDMRSRLPENRAKTYPSRGIGDIRRIVVHHTVTRADAQPQAIAQAQVKQGKAGITYHYLVGGDGTLYWTQPLESVTDQTLTPAVNANSVAVALAGNFMTAAPAADQLSGAACLIAWLLGTLNLPIDAVVGRNELEKPIASPGAQWLKGACFKDTLLDQINAIRGGVR